MLRKFYNSDAADKGGASKFTIGEGFDAQDLAAEKDTYNNREEKIEDKTEDKVEDKVEDKIIDKKEEKVEDKVEDKKEEKKEETKPVIPDWKESVKNPQYRKEILALLQIDEDAVNTAKELTTDEFAKKFLLHRKEHGNSTPFIEAATRDWDKISPEQLIMDDLKKQYSHLPSDKAEKLAKSDFNQRFTYKDDPNLSEDENKELEELTAIKLESEGLKIRAARKTEQATFLDSVKPTDRTSETTKLAEQQAQATKDELIKFAAMYDADPASVKLNAEKKIVLGKEKPFNYTVNPASIKEQTLDTNKFYGKFWVGEEGKQIFNADHWNRVMAYSENPEAFEEALIAHGMSQGLKIVDDELENATEKKDQKVSPTKKSLAKSVGEGKSFSFNGSEVN